MSLVHNANNHEADCPFRLAAEPVILPGLGRKFRVGARGKDRWVCFRNQTPFLFCPDTSLPPPNFLYYCFLQDKITHSVHNSSDSPCRSFKGQTDIAPSQSNTVTLISRDSFTINRSEFLVGGKREKNCNH